MRDDEDAVISSDHISNGSFGHKVNMKKEYWTTLMGQQGQAQAEFFADANAGSGTQVSALEILRTVEM